MSAEQFAAELALVVERLEEVHPDPWHTASRQAFLAHADALRERDEDRSRAQVYRDLAGLLAQVGETHTFVALAVGEPLRFPVEVALTAEDDLVALQDHGELARGDRIVAIGGEPVREAVARWRAHTSGDTEASREVRVVRRLSHYLALDGIVAPFSVQVQGDPPRTLVLQGAERVAPQNTFSLAEDGVGVLELRATWDEAALEPLLQEARAGLAESGRGLVVDLRRHEGGSLQAAAQVLDLFVDEPYRFAARRERKVSAPMIAQIASQGGEPGYDTAPSGSLHTVPFPLESPAPAERFEGPVAFVMSPAGHVTTALWLAAVADHDLATLVGQPLGELPTNYSESYRFPLPHSGLEVWISSARYVRPSEGSGPITPDLAVEPAADALAEARRWVLQQMAL